MLEVLNLALGLVLGVLWVLGWLAITATCISIIFGNAADVFGTDGMSGGFFIPGLEPKAGECRIKDKG